MDELRKHYRLKAFKDNVIDYCHMILLLLGMYSGVKSSDRKEYFNSHRGFLLEISNYQNVRKEDLLTLKDRLDTNLEITQKDEEFIQGCIKVLTELQEEFNSPHFTGQLDLMDSCLVTYRFHGLCDLQHKARDGIYKLGRIWNTYIDEGEPDPNR